MGVRVLFTEERIAERVRELGMQISADYSGKTVHLICVLKGAYTFLADLSRKMEVPLTIDFVRTSSYGECRVSNQDVTLVNDLDDSIQGRDVILLEDIVDTGFTLSKLLSLLHDKQPASLKVVTLLSKPSRRKVSVQVDYVGFEVPDCFVVGYGLDDNQRYRELSYLGVVD